MTLLSANILRLLLFCLAVVASTRAASPAEKSVLLQFKASVTSDPRGALASWSAGGDPCTDFRGVFCDPVTGAVERIVIHGAGLAGTLSGSLAGLPALKALSLFANRFAGVVPPAYNLLSPSLHKLNLSRNALSGPVPAFLGGFPGLRLLDLSHNLFTGAIPATLFTTCLRTRYVSFAGNNLTGPVPATIGNCARLVGFDFSGNQLTGGLPAEVCSPPELNYLSVSGNALSGAVARNLTACESLDFFDISGNAFSGPAPFTLLASSNITVFNISNNEFDGEIADISACGPELDFIDASGNRLDGAVPAGLAKCDMLRWLDLSSNAAVSGLIPPDLGNLQFLQFLDLAGLNLSGEIPASLSQCTLLLDLNLSGNSLDGTIPDGFFYNLTHLKNLDLRRNRLAGAIPTTLGNLGNLQSLDLSENAFSGPVPPALGNLMGLKQFNVSYNNLSGEIPASPWFLQFGASAFIGNRFLCGLPLPLKCGALPPSGSSAKSKGLSVSVIIVIVAAAILFVGICLITAMNITAYRRGRNVTAMEEAILVSESTSMASPPPPSSNVIVGKLVLFSKSLPSRYEDWEAGTKALLDKDCIIGGGSMGTVYKAMFDGGVSIAVKKLETLGRITGQDEFEQEMGRLGGLSHPYLVALHGYYWSSTMKLMLSEFVANGSLHDHLHGSHHEQLDWEGRFKVAVGTARALAYLHHDCRPPILHLNVKSSNILLGERFEAKLGDYGLGKMLPILGSFDFSRFHTAVGYVAPELAAQSLRYSDKCDVYSFGIVLLEIVSGRRPVESSGAGRVVVLRDYVRVALGAAAAADCIDAAMPGGYVEAELVQVLKLGLVCSSETPARRPSMAEVVQVLESIRGGDS